MTKSSDMTMEEAIAFSKRVEKGVVIISCGIMLIGAITLLVSIKNYYIARASETWNHVSGVITQSEVISRRSMSSNSSSGTTPDVITYSPNIVYQYEVNENLYSNDKIRFGAIGGTNISETRNLVAKYSIGKKAPVYYSEGDPSNSVLQKGITTKKSYGAIIGGIVFLLMGFLFYKSKKVYANPIYFVGHSKNLDK